MDTAADFRLRAGPARGGALTVAMMTAMIVVGYLGINLLYERFNPSSDQIFDSLSEATFGQSLLA